MLVRDQADIRCKTIRFVVVLGFRKKPPYIAQNLLQLNQARSKSYFIHVA